MPDIGFLELIFIGIIGFLVLGPERLPELFKQISGFLRQGRIWLGSLKDQLDQEKSQLAMPLSEIKHEAESIVKESVMDVSGKDKL